MTFENIFKSVLLEALEDPSGNVPAIQRDGQRRHPSGQESFEGSLDKGTDPNEFLTQGLKASVEAVQRDFNRRMTSFANSLSPQAVKTMTIGKLKHEINKVFKYVDGIQAFAKAKIDALAQQPAAILAAFIAADPAKQRAFENLHKQLEEFNKALMETEGGLAQLKGQIDEFVDDISGKAADEVIAKMATDPNDPAAKNLGQQPV